MVLKMLCALGESSLSIGGVKDIIPENISTYFPLESLFSTINYPSE